MNYLRKVLIFSIVLLVCGFQSISLANDTWDTAGELAPIGEWSNNMDPAGDVDWFYVDIAVAGLFEIWSDSNLDMYCNLYDSNLNWIDDDDDSAGDLDFYIARNLSPGRYYIRIHELNGAVGRYDLYSYFTSCDPTVLNNSPDPNDSNGTRTDADDLDVPGTLDYSISPECDVDWLRLNVTSNGTLNIWTTGSTDTTGFLTDNNGNVLEFDDDGGTDFNFLIQANVNAGTYYVAVQAFGTGDYTVHAESGGGGGCDPTVLNNSPDPNDSNGTRTDADDLDVPGTLDYSISPECDVDWLRLNVTSNGTLNIWTTGSTDTTGFLTDNNGNVLEFDDDGGTDFNFLIQANVNAGTYYVAVQAFGTGDYTVHAESGGGGGCDPTVLNNSPDPNDSNGTRTDADDLDVPGTLDYSISPECDVDWLRLNVTSNGTLNIWTTGSTDTTGFLTDNNGNVLEFDDDGGTDFNFLIQANVNAGTYYVAVQAFGTGDYTVHAELTTGPPPSDDLPRSPNAGDTNGWWTGAAILALDGMRDDFQISPIDDVDYLSIDVPGSGLLEVWTTGDIDTFGTLIDGNQNILGTDDDDGAALNFHISANVRAGTHYIAIEGFETGRYAIHSRFTPGVVSDPADVNNDGVVDVDDLVQVATHFGTTNAEGDVNGDGVVDREDILLVLDALEEEVDPVVEVLGAPPRTASTAESLRQWIDLAKLRNNPDMKFQKGIAVLEQLLATLLEQEMVPGQTALLTNYPNPFNPETWIPYHLSEPAEVTLNIYSASGQLVRTLTLGHQPAGIYESKSRAAYWDGRNAVGERVASGLYFYTLTAGDFAATRKMLIMK